MFKQSDLRSRFGSSSVKHPLLCLFSGLRIDEDATSCVRSGAVQTKGENYAIKVVPCSLYGASCTPPKKITLTRYDPQVKGDLKAIKQAVELLAKSKKPVFYCGGGVINSGPAASPLVPGAMSSPSRRTPIAL